MNNNLEMIKYKYNITKTLIWREIKNERNVMRNLPKEQE